MPGKPVPGTGAGDVVAIAIGRVDGATSVAGAGSALGVAQPAIIASAVSAAAMTMPPVPDRADQYGPLTRTAPRPSPVAGAPADIVQEHAQYGQRPPMSAVQGHGSAGGQRRQFLSDDRRAET